MNISKNSGTAITGFNIAIVGGGSACKELLRLIETEAPEGSNLRVLGVSDPNLKASGILYAKEHNIFTTSDFKELYSLEGLDLLIELTGSEQVKEEILRTKPKHLSFIDHRGAKFVWDFIQLEIEKSRLLDEKQKYEEKEKKHTQLILDSLPYRIMVINLDMTIDTVNKTFLEEFGLTKEQVKGKKCYEIRYNLQDPCYEKGDVCFLQETLKDIKDIKRKKTITAVKEQKNEKGETVYEAITISPIFNEKGEIQQLLETSRNVTDRIKLEKELQKSKTFFEKVIQSTVDGIVVVDTKGNVLIFNEGMERLTGHKAEEIMNKGHLSSFYDIDTAKENMRKMRSNKYGPVGMLNPTSMTITTKDGDEIPVTLSASIIKIDGKEIGSVGVFRDMREILQMRKELEDAHLQLVQSEKIASIGRMAAGVAHEINNPLSGIMIYAELLKGQIKDNKQALEDLNEIIEQTMRCKRIVSELLEFSRQSVGKVSSFSMEELVDKSLSIIINQALFQDIEVVRDIPKDIPNMVGDMGQLQQVLINLFTNAVDAMKGKGRLTIKGEFIEHKGEFKIYVSDTGPGIPENLRDKVFDIFFTTKPVGKGTGLGLSISQNIIKLHGGNITFECPKEGGTTFIIELPLGFMEESKKEPLFIGLDDGEKGNHISSRR